MGTNVYFYHKLNQEQLELIRREFAELDNIPDMKRFINTLYVQNDEIHVGKFSAGWEFIFGEEIYKLCGKEQISKDSIISFLSTGILLDEYGRSIPIETFWTDYVDKGKGGYTKKSYFKEFPEYTPICRYDFYVNGLNFEEGEFS